MISRPLAAGVGALVALGIALGVAAGTRPAGAQEGSATIQVEQVHPSATAVHYYVSLTDGDGEPISGATVTAIPTQDDGTQGAPEPLTPSSDPGLYQGTVELSAQGTWTVTFASTQPEASLAYTQEMPAEESGGAAGDDDGGGSAVVLVVVGIVVVILVAFGAWALLGRRRPAPAEAGAAAEAGPEDT
jgi:hypothetical protein